MSGGDTAQRQSAGQRSRLRLLAREYEAGSIGREDYRQRRRQLIQSFTSAGDGDDMATTMALAAPHDPAGTAEPGAQPGAADLSRALSARPLTQFTPRDGIAAAHRAGGTGGPSAVPSASGTQRRRRLSGALFAALGLVTAATLLGLLLSAMLAN